MNKKRIVVAISGASGTVYAINLLKKLKGYPDIETHVAMSDWTHENLKLELDMSHDGFASLYDVFYPNKGLGAKVAPGSFLTNGMVTVLASMKTMAGIAYGFSDNLTGRAADVALKEQRKLVIVPRETPLNTIHLRDLTKLSRMGVQVIPLVPAFYNHSKTLQNIIGRNTIRLLDVLHIHSDYAGRWGGDQIAAFEVADYGYSIQAQVDYIGADLFTQLTGGSHPHVGTVTTYCRGNADKQVVRFPSHSGRFYEDNVLVGVLLEEITELLSQNCVITSGVHIDGISKEQIVSAFEITKEFTSKIVAWLKNEGSPTSHPKYQKRNIK